jgi:hypothetical protein
MAQTKTTPKELMTLTVAELKALARKNSVELKSSLKADIARELSKALKSKKKPAKKAPAKKSASKKKAAVKKKTAAPARKKTTKKTAAKPAASSKTKKKPEPKAPPPEKARTPMPVGTVPPRAPKSPVEKSNAKRAEEPRPWSPKTPEAVSGNWASAIPVEPGRLFVNWDIKQGDVKHGRRLVLRVQDITEIQSQGEEKPPSFIQVPVKSLSGGMFVSVTSGRSYRAIIGTMGMDGDFLPLIAADPIATPTGTPSEGASLLGEEHFLAGTPSGKDPLSSY